MGDYVAPVTAEELHYRELPVTIRVLHELEDNLTAVQAKADGDMRFFRDLWNQLNSPTGLRHLKITGPGRLLVDLKVHWVDGWDGANGQSLLVPRSRREPGPQQPGVAMNFEMPVDGQLIDFLWSHTMVGGAGQRSR